MIENKYEFKRNENTSVNYDKQVKLLNMVNEINYSLNKDCSNCNLKNMYENNEHAEWMLDTLLKFSHYNLESYKSLDLSLALKTSKSKNQHKVIELFNFYLSEYNNSSSYNFKHLFINGMMSAFVIDQVLNVHLENVRLSDNDILIENKNYTEMEHIWDQAFGLVFSLEDKDILLNKYLSNIDGVADKLFKMFKDGREAIVMKSYDLVHLQILNIRKLISDILLENAINNVKEILKNEHSDEDKLNNLNLIINSAFNLLYSNYDGKSHLSIDELIKLGLFKLNDNKLRLADHNELLNSKKLDVYYTFLLKKSANMKANLKVKSFTHEFESKVVDGNTVQMKSDQALKINM